MRRLVAHSQRIAGLRAPLTRHPRLSEEMAQQLYQWVGQALRQSISERFRIDDRLLNAAIQDAAHVAAGGAACRSVPQPSGRAEDLERTDLRGPAQDVEFVLYHSDNVEASGFVQHLKLPHYVDFQAELELVRALRKGKAAGEKEHGE